MKELDNFTVERLEDLIDQYVRSRYNSASDDEVIELVRIALAAKRAEPVAYMRESDEGREYNAHNEFSCGGRGIPLYDVPQLNSQQQWIKCRDQIPEGYVIITRDMLADYRDVKNAEVESYKAGFAGYYEQEGTRWARDFEDLCEELMAIDDALAAAPEKP